MKKTLITIATIIAIITLAGCTSAPEETTTPAETTTTTAVTTTTPEETTTAPVTTTTTAATTTTAPETAATPSQEEIDAALSEAAELEQEILEQAATTTTVTTEATTEATTTAPVVTTTKAATTTASEQSYTDINGNTYTVKYGKELPDVPKPDDATGVETIDDLGGKFYTKYAGGNRYVWLYINAVGWLWSENNGDGGVEDNSDWESDELDGYMVFEEPDGTMNPDKIVTPDGKVITREEYEALKEEHKKSKNN